MMSRVLEAIKNHRIFAIIYSLFASLIFKLTQGEQITLRQDYIAKKMYKKYFKNIPKIKEFYANDDGLEIPKKVRIIWLQGIDHAPEIVKACVKSAEKCYKGWEIQIIDKDNFEKFTKIPSCIIDKWKNNIISHTHFADIIRFSLLIEYGGIYMDATVFNFRCIDEFYLDKPFFTFYSSFDNQKMVNFFMASKPNNQLLIASYKLLLDYWTNHNYLADYFITTLLFGLVVKKNQDLWDKLFLIHERQVHILVKYLMSPYDIKLKEQIEKQCFLQKLSYKKNLEINENTFISKLLEGNEL